MPEPVKNSFVILVYLALILSTLLVFQQVRNFSFVNYDDSDYVYDNPHVLNGLSSDGVIWAFTTNRSANWHPLTWLSLMLDCQLFGPNPGYMHLVNLIFHLANALLLFTLLRKLTGALWPSAFAAAAFALHPMHVESVAWIAERKDVLSTLFLLLTLLAYVAYVKRTGLFRYVLTLLLFALGLLAKPMLVTLPLLLILLDYWPLERFRNSKSAIRHASNPVMGNQKFSILNSAVEKIPFFVLSIASSVITFLIQYKSSAVAYISILPLKVRIANAFVSYIRYIYKLFWPQNLAVFYPFDADSFAFWQVASCVLLLIVISVLVLRFRRNQKYLPVGWFWFVITLIPVIGLVQVGLQAYADRYTYIPYIGLFIMLAWGLPALLSKLPHRKYVLGLLMVMTLTILGICAHRQTSFWNNNLTLFSHAIEVTQNNYIAFNNRGVAYDKIGRYKDAVEDYKQAVKINPEYSESFYNLGLALGKLGRTQDSIEPYKQAIKLRPDYTKALCNLGVAYDQLGRRQEAIEAYKQAIKIKPDYAEAYLNLGVTYYRLGQYKDAIEPYKQAIKFKPDFVTAHFNLGVDYFVLGDKNSALDQYKILKILDAGKANELFELINK